MLTLNHIGKCYVFFLLVFYSLFLNGCAPITQQQKDRWSETIPYCYSKPDCTAKWAAARNWVQNNASVKIQIYSDDLIETYNPSPNSPKIAARVTKEPNATSTTGDQSYYFGIKVWCNNIFGCIPTADESILSFNNYVSSIQDNDARCYKSTIDDKKPKMGINMQLYNSNKYIIKKVCTESPAYKAGLQPNDVLYKIVTRLFRVTMI